jgi:predicted DNA-binding ribbon-helix-helix protein
LTRDTPSTEIGDANGAQAMRKRSVVIAGHRTSVSLETAFWSGLKEIAEQRGISVNRLVETIDASRGTNLSSAIRVFVLQCYKD